MLSSITDDKPVASTWLTRLRLNRGLTTTEDDDASGNPLTLDDFLRRNHHTEITGTSSASDSPPSAPIRSDPELAESPSEDPNPGEWYGVMTDVLSELFNFDGGGGSSKSSTIQGKKKKLPRKQSNPRHCSLETPEEDVVVPLANHQKITDANCVPSVREFATSSSRSSYNKKPPAKEIKERRRSVVAEEEVEGVEEEEEEKGEKDLVGFSRSEVTVIDTSFKVWKSEKLVFRRRNVWKVRDKKGKSKVVSKTKKMMMKKKKKKKKMKKKKRKCDDDDDGEIAKKSKKMKSSSSVPDNHLHRSVEEIYDEPESSNASRRLPSKPRKEGSFGILHTSKKNSEAEARGYRSLA
ncbi:PREDICTED: uncharacterized protein LOC104770849 [Camelina sativa]|uniref:Uncharacterized protein LOC104770849 n=1 Tax=Camelina sativa TaxID=90675 RepID=A0ABM0Y0G4_CAMSA|nr:PREDICTED: uncharacterized protein LOC104770849 [Camelina sativa]